MDLKDIYLDKDVQGYIVFNTLSKRHIYDVIEGNCINIQDKDVIQLGKCLVIPIEDHSFIDYLDFYKKIMKMSTPAFHEAYGEVTGHSMKNVLLNAPLVREDAVIIGTTMWQHSFLLKMNIRHQCFVLDIYFEDGKSYSYQENQLYELDEVNQYQKYIKKYHLEEWKDE